MNSVAIEQENAKTNTEIGMISSSPIQMRIEQINATRTIPNTEIPSDVVILAGNENSKKRGRKPKGGKIKEREPEKPSDSKSLQNVILHLRCSMNDLNNHNDKMGQMVTNPHEYNPDIPPNILTYNNNSKLHPFSTAINNQEYNAYTNCSTTGTSLNVSSAATKKQLDHYTKSDIAYNDDIYRYTKMGILPFPVTATTSNEYYGSNQEEDGEDNGGELKERDNMDNTNNKEQINYSLREDIATESMGINTNTNKKTLASKLTVKSGFGEQCAMCKNRKETSEEISTREINQKLKNLKIMFYKNIHLDKKSACFWCTYEFDNPACYIPKYENDQAIVGYGSFCRPECSVAYLMKENIDDSTKFERYHLLNKIYGGIYNYNKNIKPAPNPYYLLDKYYGNLTIQEYRKLLKTEHTLVVLEKPLTRMLPELHDDSEEIALNYMGDANAYNNPKLDIKKGLQTIGVGGGGGSSGGVGSGGYKVKRQLDRTNEVSKKHIMKETFGIH